MWQVIGQSQAVSLLQQSFAAGRIVHAYLFIGPQHIGKMTLALHFAQALNCEAAEPPCRECIPCQKITTGNHADVQVVVYDDRGGGFLARPWWTLRYLEQNRVALLDSDFPAWVKAGLPLHKGSENRIPRVFKAQVR